MITFDTKYIKKWNLNKFKTFPRIDLTQHWWLFNNKDTDDSTYKYPFLWEGNIYRPHFYVWLL